MAFFAKHAQRRIVDHGNAPGRVADHEPQRQAGHYFSGHGLLVAQDAAQAAGIVHPEK